MFKDMRQINPGLGSLVNKDMRLVNPGPPAGMQPQQQPGLPGRGGGLARLMQMYGRPGAFGHAQMVQR